MAIADFVHFYLSLVDAPVSHRSAPIAALSAEQPRAAVTVTRLDHVDAAAQLMPHCSADSVCMRRLSLAI